MTNVILIVLRDYNYGEILSLLIFSYIFQVMIIVGKPYDEKIEN
jgi:hypothetical protein